MMHDKRFPASQAERLDNPERLLWLPPADVISALAVHTGEIVADVGAGTGYFALPLSIAVGAAGRVYAVDGESEMLARLKVKLDQMAFQNIELIHAEAEQTGLPASSCDLFFLANLWHEIEDRTAVLLEASRALKTGGRIAILDWRTDVEAVHGPPLAHRIAPDDALREMQRSGFKETASGKIGKSSWLVQGVRLQ
jgi:ubiquinone/menaquinone biosynthesis C-methylase UbiE